jgi:hypothetical protein
MLTLREIGERTAAARDLKGFWSQVIKGLEFNGMQFEIHPCDSMPSFSGSYMATFLL